MVFEERRNSLDSLSFDLKKNASWVQSQVPCPPPPKKKKRERKTQFSVFAMQILLNWKKRMISSYWMIDYSTNTLFLMCM
jgi:hypothetical protein